jgi:hypothetical protein
MKSCRFGICALAAYIMLASTAANANVIVTFGGVAAGGGSTWDWTYNVTLNADQNVDTQNPAPNVPSFVTVYDFGQINSVIVSASLSTWVVSTNFSDTHAFQTSPTDSASILNVRLSAPDGIFISGSAPLGSFVVNSDWGPTDHFVSFDGQAVLKPPFNTEQGNAGLVAAPVPGPLAGVGLPGLFAACGGLIALARRRRRSARA